MKIPIRIMATRPPSPILFRHIVAAIAIPLAACAFAYAIALAVLAG